MFRNEGFTLLELIVVVVIVGLTAVWALPDFRRGIAQSKVDRYTRNIESGLFSLRARMGAIKGSCQINFTDRSGFSEGRFAAPEDLLERQQADGSLSDEDALKSCRESFADDTNINAEAFRLVNMEGSRERDSVEIALKTDSYSFTPPGTTANANDLTILIRSKQSETAGILNSLAKVLPTRTRCILVTGNGQVFSGTWSDEEEECLSKQM